MFAAIHPASMCDGDGEGAPLPPTGSPHAQRAHRRPRQPSPPAPAQRRLRRHDRARHRRPLRRGRAAAGDRGDVLPRRRLRRPATRRGRAVDPSGPRAAGRGRPRRDAAEGGDGALGGRDRRGLPRHRRPWQGARPARPRPLRAPARRGARARHRALLPLPGGSRAQPRRPLPHPARCGRDPGVVLLRARLLPGLVPRPLHRPPPPRGGGGPRPRRLRRRLHLRVRHHGDEPVAPGRRGG